MIIEKEKWVFKVNIIGTIVLILLILIADFWVSRNNISPYLVTEKNSDNQKEEMKQHQSGNNDFKNDFTEAFATIYAISQITRFIILFVCTVDRRAYRLLLPVTQLIHLTHTVIFSGHENGDEGIQYLIITMIVPLVLFSTLRYSLIITVATNSVIFCVLRPLIKGADTFSVFIGFCTCLLSAILLILYDKAITSNLWSKLKMSLANDELHEVVNASN